MTSDSTVDKRLLEGFTQSVAGPIEAAKRRLESFLAGHGRDMDPKQTELLRLSLLAHQDVLHLLDNVRDAGRLGLPDAAAGSASLGRILSEIIEFYLPFAEHRGVVLAAKGPSEAAILAGSPVLLRRLFTNLVHNALKFTPAGGTVTVEWARSADGWRVAVRDTGRGIPPEKLQALFAPFGQALREDRSEGFGLGLGICQAIARLHGGSVSVASDPGLWTEFTVRLPERAGRAQQG